MITIKNKDIFELQKELIKDSKYNENIYIVIPTNIGWKKDRYNVMGRGLAYQCKQKYPKLAKYIGKYYQREFDCYINKEYRYDNDSKLLLFNSNIDKEFRFICMPTKALNVNQPYLSWKNNSSLEVIEESCKELDRLFSEQILHLRLIDIVLMPMLGCGNGGLNAKDVYPILKKYFDKYDNIILLY